MKKLLALPSTLIAWFIARYSKHANTAIAAGRRPHRLPCEGDQACSELFAADLNAAGAGTAITNMQNRCPKGKSHALKALGVSAAVVLIPVIAMSASDDCFPPVDGALGCGS